MLLNFCDWAWVDVMISIFYDFRHFSAKKLAFFSKTNVLIKILHKLALLLFKNAIFLLNFLPKYLKNHNIGPWHRYLSEMMKFSPVKEKLRIFTGSKKTFMLKLHITKHSKQK
jgi:hypothetical protein